MSKRIIFVYVCSFTFPYVQYVSCKTSDYTTKCHLTDAVGQMTGNACEMLFDINTVKYID